MRVAVESTIRWRGSVTDLATDVADLLTPEEGKKLISELQRFQTLPHLAHKWAGKGHEEVPDGSFSGQFRGKRA